MVRSHHTSLFPVSFAEKSFQRAKNVRLMPRSRAEVDAAQTHRFPECLQAPRQAARRSRMLCSDGCSTFCCCFKCQCEDKYEEFQVRSRCSLASLLGQRHPRVRSIILTQREHRIVSRGPRAGEQAKSEEGEETAGFFGCSKTPFHSQIRGLNLPRVVIILPCPPSPSRVRFSPA